MPYVQLALPFGGSRYASAGADQHTRTTRRFLPLAQERKERKAQARRIKRAKKTNNEQLDALALELEECDQKICEVEKDLKDARVGPEVIAAKAVEIAVPTDFTMKRAAIEAMLGGGETAL